MLPNVKVVKLLYFGIFMPLAFDRTGNLDGGGEGMSMADLKGTHAVLLAHLIWLSAQR